MKEKILRNVLFFTILMMITACAAEVSEESAEPVRDTIQVNPAPAEVPQPARQFTTYHNQRFNFCFIYLEDEFKPSGEAQNSDGNIFYSSDGKMKVAVYGYNNVLDHNIDELLQFDLKNNPDKKILKRELTSGYYMISGNIGKVAFIEKRVIAGSDIKVIQAEFPGEERAAFEHKASVIVDDFPKCE